MKAPIKILVVVDDDDFAISGSGSLPGPADGMPAPKGIPLDKTMGARRLKCGRSGRLRPLVDQQDETHDCRIKFCGLKVRDGLCGVFSLLWNPLRK